MKTKNLSELNRLRLDTLIETVAEETSISREDILSESRWDEVCRSRHILCYLAAELFSPAKMSYAQIGGYLNKDHSSVMHGKESIQNAMDVYPRIKQTVTNIKNKVEIKLKEIAA